MLTIRDALMAATLSFGMLAGAHAASAPLRLEVYNPGDKGIFAVSAELITGRKEAILIDAQFARSDAENW